MSNVMGERIRQLRKMHKMSQEELGRRVGVQRAAINKYEKGTVTNVPINTIERIANTFEVSPIYIVGWSGKDLYQPLALEVKIIQGVKQFYGSEGVALLETYTKLNSTGRRRLRLYLDDIYQVYGSDEV